MKPSIYICSFLLFFNLTGCASQSKTPALPSQLPATEAAYPPSDFYSNDLQRASSMTAPQR